MADVEQPQGTIELLSPRTEEEWSHADILITELKEWDARQCHALGFERDEVLSVFYPDSTSAIRHASVPPEGCFLLAIDASLPLGCAAFRRWAPGVCELFDVYVRPSSRGRGIALKLLRRLMGDAQVAGYRTMILETAVFMHRAHSLYQSLGFEARAPYRTIPAKFAKATLWMECALAS